MAVAVAAVAGEAEPAVGEAAEEEEAEVAAEADCRVWDDTCASARASSSRR